MKKAAVEADFQAMAADLGIGEIAHKYPNEISGGSGNGRLLHAH